MGNPDWPAPPKRGPSVQSHTKRAPQLRQHGAFSTVRPRAVRESRSSPSSTRSPLTVIRGHDLNTSTLSALPQRVILFRLRSACLADTANCGGHKMTRRKQCAS